jgi:hypothetical protein
MARANTRSVLMRPCVAVFAPRRWTTAMTMLLRDGVQDGDVPSGGRTPTPNGNCNYLTRPALLRVAATARSPRPDLGLATCPGRAIAGDRLSIDVTWVLAAPQGRSHSAAAMLDTGPGMPAPSRLHAPAITWRIPRAPDPTGDGDSSGGDGIELDKSRHRLAKRLPISAGGAAPGAGPLTEMGNALEQHRYKPWTIRAIRDTLFLTRWCLRGLPRLVDGQEPGAEFIALDAMGDGIASGQRHGRTSKPWVND